MKIINHFIAQKLQDHIIYTDIEKVKTAFYLVNII